MHPGMKAYHSAGCVESCPPETLNVVGFNGSGVVVEKICCQLNLVTWPQIRLVFFGAEFFHVAYVLEGRTL